MTSRTSSPPPRRRRADSVVRERTSLSLPVDALQAVREFVRIGMADNVSAFVEAALREKIRRIGRDGLYAAYEAAARDENFRREMREVTETFRNADGDGL